MSLVLKFFITELDNCESIKITEVTGAYDASLNSGGWGAPNPTIASATSATLLIEKRNSDGTYTAYNTIDLYNTLPNITETPFSITSDDAGFGTNSTFPDGIYRMTYTVAGSGFSAQTIKYIVLYGQIKICFKESSLALSQCSCNCDSLEDSLVNIDFYIGQLAVAQDSGNLTWINNTLEKLTNLCTECGCGC